MVYEHYKTNWHYSRAFIICINYLLFQPEDLSKEGIAVLATALWVAVWWITEAVPIATAALCL